MLDDGAKHNLISNIVGHLGNAKQNIQYRQTALFYKADAEYGIRVAEETPRFAESEGARRSDEVTA